MKLTGFHIYELNIPLKKAYVLSKEYGVFSKSGIIVVEAITDEGIVGYGECDPWELFTGDNAEMCALVLRTMICPKLIGKDPRNIHEIHQTMDSCIRNNHLAKSAIDMAMYDILGKSSNLPVHTLLGGKRRKTIDVMWSIGGSTPEESAAEVLKVKELGYRGCMIKVGGENMKLDAERTIAVREAVGPDFALNADANQGWDVDTAIRYAKMVEHCDLMFFEQPVQSWDVEGMARIRRSVNIPISADEGVMTIQDALRLIKQDAVDIFSIKVTKNGGILPATEICHLAQTHGIKLFFNSMIEEGITQAASLAIGATVSDLVPMGHAYFSVQRMKSDITDYSRLLNPDGTVTIPDEPGLGVTLNYEEMKKYLIRRYDVM